MSVTRSTLNTLIAGAFALSLTGMGSDPAHAQKGGTEKCYGIVKAGHNDCGNAAKTHSCAGLSTADGDGGEWAAVPKGLCDKLVGGSLTPYEGVNPRLEDGKNG